jgi:hypothetical protein
MARENGIMSLATLGTPLASLILKNLPYVLFLGFLGTVYIANVHYAENKMREIKQLQSEISELRWRYMAAKADLMYNSKQSEVLKRVEDLGLSDAGRRPKKIVVRKEDY